MGLAARLDLPRRSAAPDPGAPRAGSGGGPRSAAGQLPRSADAPLAGPRALPLRARGAVLPGLRSRPRGGARGVRTRQVECLAPIHQEQRAHLGSGAGPAPGRSRVARALPRWEDLCTRSARHCARADAHGGEAHPGFGADGDGEQTRLCGVPAGSGRPRLRARARPARGARRRQGTARRGAGRVWRRRRRATRPVAQTGERAELLPETRTTSSGAANCRRRTPFRAMPTRNAPSRD
ncbi:hypothetical protein BH11GEM1_BH11GEM1_34860 [soil metagenome]